MRRIFVILTVVCMLSSCGGNDKPAGTAVKQKKNDVVVPAFNADSAYGFVERQLSFGPRVPGSIAHEQCAEWFVSKLNAWADSVFVQDFRCRLFDGKTVDGKNIIASYNIEAHKRIIIASHWDSRPYADNDPD